MVAPSLARRGLVLPLPALLIASVLASMAIYAALVASFFPTVNGTLGHDYEYFLPALLAGKYWVAQNGLLSVPRFTPAFCAGVPLLANPQSLFYSVPQGLALVIDPVASYRLTSLLFGGAGGVGTYFLLARRFGVSPPAALLSAVIFLFNGFLMYRMAIGHVTYHVVGLIPLLCWFLLTPLSDGGLTARTRSAVGPIVGAAAVFTYFVYAGAPNMLVQLGLICVSVWLIHSLRRPPRHSFWLIGGAAAAIAAAAGAAKLAAALVWLAEFPRAHAIVLIDDLPALLTSLLRGLFFPATLPSVDGRHEWEFGVGLMPLFLLLRGARVALARLGRVALAPRSVAYWLRLLALATLMLFPIWLNFGDADKAAWLKTLPYIGDNVVLVRWFAIYVLPLTVAAGCLLDFAFETPRQRLSAALIGIVVTVAQPLLADRGYYQRQPYDPASVLAADQLLASSGQVPAIRAIGSGPAAGRNDGLAAGRSSFPCYEPMFGYRLETFPGSPTLGALADGAHLRNPACYLYGSANHCSPGAAFTEAQRVDEAAFADYGAFDFELPEWQVWADRVSLLALGMLLAGSGAALWFCVRRPVTR